MKIVLLLHGLKDPNANGLLRLKKYLEAAGYRTFALHYGWFMVRGFLWPLFNVPLSRLIVAFTEILHELGHQIILIGHSNGATVAAKASALGAYFDALVFIDGAVERDVKLGQNTGWLLNYRTPTDPVLNIARVIAPLTPWAGFDGSLGSSGVKPDSDPRMWDCNLTEELGIKFSHSGFMSEEIVDKSGPLLVKGLDWLLGQNPHLQKELRT